MPASSSHSRRGLNKVTTEDSPGWASRKRSDSRCPTSTQRRPVRASWLPPPSTSGSPAMIRQSANRKDVIGTPSWSLQPGRLLQQMGPRNWQHDESSRDGNWIKEEAAKWPPSARTNGGLKGMAVGVKVGDEHSMGRRSERAFANSAPPCLLSVHSQFIFPSPETAIRFPGRKGGKAKKKWNDWFLFNSILKPG